MQAKGACSVLARSKTSLVLLFSALCLVVFVGVVLAEDRQQGADKGAQSASAASEASKYVGAETCKTCHEEIYNSWEKTPHWKTTLNKKGGPSKQGCEGCHGPGCGPRGRRRRQNQDIRVRGTVTPGDQRSLSELPRRSSPAVALCGIRPRQQRRWMSRLPFSPSRQGKATPASPEPAPVVLRMPYFGQGRFCQTLSPPGQRGSGAMQ